MKPPAGMTPTGEGAVVDGAQEELIAATQRLIAMRARSFAAAVAVPWADRSQRRVVHPAGLPVLRWLPACASAAPPATRALARVLDRAAPALAWRRSYGASDVGCRFFENYGWTELVGLTGPVPCAGLACGFLVLGADIAYPPHHHEALELYLPLAGRASWWQAGSGWREIPPGGPVRHARWKLHAMRTHAQPLLALYLWRSRNLAQHATLT